MSIVPKKMLDEKVRFVIVGSDEVPAYLDPRHREKNPTLRSPLCCHRTPSSPLSPGQKISVAEFMMKIGQILAPMMFAI